MPTNRTPLQRPRRLSISPDEALSLHYGDLPGGRPAFAGEQERQAAWMHHRDHLLAAYWHGRRPMAWWSFDARDLRYPGYDRERSTLHQAGVLGEDEARELVAWWRQEFEKAQQDGFTVCLGPGRFLKGAPALLEHLRWADIPAELVEQWSAEQLAETAAEDPPPAA